MLGDDALLFVLMAVSDANGERGEGEGGLFIFVLVCICIFTQMFNFANDTLSIALPQNFTDKDVMPIVKFV